MLATEVARDARVKVNLHSGTTASRVRNFTRMNSTTLFGSKVEDDPQGFIHELFKALDAMAVYSKDMVELYTYKLKDVTQI